METEQDQLRNAIVRFNFKLMALVFGLMSGLLIFVMTIWLVIKGGHVTPDGEYVVGPHLQLLGQFFIGYRVSLLGSVIGFFYGFAAGAMAGSALGLIYNRLADLRQSIRRRA